MSRIPLTTVKFYAFVVLCLSLVLIGAAISSDHDAFATLLLLLAGGAVLILGGCDIASIGRVDIWESQSRLMSASDQPQPEVAMLTHAGVRYLGLIAEELSETACEMAILVRRHGQSTETIGLANVCQRLADQLKTDALALRQALVRVPDSDLNILPSSAVEMQGVFDGVTDIAVTTAGMGLALGLPCGEGYAEVQRSNASKGNPVTGKIDKDDSGKWIKGPNYREPDLGQLLVDQRQAYYSQDE